ncbi:hypothetical protein [Thalassovita sp.]|uniref:hypothetical protein n=1 Tax=Thalassovita sp. TaxID=1979401 RepID=UPI002B26C0C1|nr:hypothetical protein [Thalassovita sp.]
MLNKEQFDTLVETLGSEPAFNLWSGMLWIGFASFLVGVVAIAFTVRESRRSRAGADAELILMSFKDYENLYDSLRSVPDLENEHLELLANIPDELFYDEALFDVVGAYKGIDPKKWGKARETKMYFKSRFELVGKGFFSNKAIANTMDHAGANLVRRQLRKLDIIMFYQVRQEKFRRGEFTKDYLARTFREDLDWYEQLPKFMKGNKTTFGWDT